MRQPERHTGPVLVTGHIDTPEGIVTITSRCPSWRRYDEPVLRYLNCALVADHEGDCVHEIPVRP